MTIKLDSSDKQRVWDLHQSDPQTYTLPVLATRFSVHPKTIRRTLNAMRAKLSA